MTKNDPKTKTSLLQTALFVVLCACLVYGSLLCPLPRQIGLTFRETLYVFPVVLLAAWACCSAKNSWLRIVLLSLLFGIVLLPYSGLLNSGMSDQYALGGIIPWSDAFTMQLNTQRFLYGGMMGQATAIRPLSVVFYAVFLRCSGNNYFALQIFLCCLTALSMLFAMEEVKRNFGSLAGSVFFTIMFYYIRQRLGTYMTEPFGFICGLLSSFWILRSVRTIRQPSMLTGFLMLSIGLNARPAAMFLFPALGLWYFFVFLRKEPKRFLWAGLALLMMLAGFAVNKIAQKVVYGDKEIPNRQAAEMVYGLCLGGQSWGDVVGLPEITALNDSDNVIRDVAGLCAPIIKEHPENIIKALKTIFIDSLIRSPYYGAFSYVNGNPKGLQTAFRYGLMALWTAGIIILISRRKNPLYSLLTVSAAGIILSECAAVPFSTNYLRLYAVSMWVPAIITGLLPQLLWEKIIPAKAEDKQLIFPKYETAAAFLCVMVLIVSGFGAFLIRKNPLPLKQAEKDICQPDEDVLVTSVDRGSFIYLTDQSKLDAEHYPYFRLPYVRQHIHDTASIEMFPFTDAIETPTAVIRGMDMGNYMDALIFAPLELVEGKTGTAQFCGHFVDPPILRDDRFFIPTSVVFYEDEL